jgi:hypothetical protein
MKNIYAPIALFTYSRADHTRSAVESLLKNKESAQTDLFIFSDGPKTEDKREAVEENRKYIKTIKGFKSIHIVEHENNQGLSNSLIAGITGVVNQYGRVIVVEDDLIVSPYFLQYMNEALEKYRDDDRVASISAFLNPIDCEAPDTFFLRYFACWGWATWKRGWNLFNPDARSLLRQMRWKKKSFNINNSSNFYGMLYCQKVGLVDSWAVRFYASSFLANKLVLFPGRSLAIQTGIDGSGTHSGKENSKYANMILSGTRIPILDIPVEENKHMFEAFSRFYHQGQSYNMRWFYDEVKSFVRRLIGLDFK